MREYHFFNWVSLYANELVNKEYVFQTDQVIVGAAVSAKDSSIYKYFIFPGYVGGLIRTAEYKDAFDETLGVIYRDTIDYTVAKHGSMPEEFESIMMRKTPPKQYQDKIYNSKFQLIDHFFNIFRINPCCVVDLSKIKAPTELHEGCSVYYFLDYKDVMHFVEAIQPTPLTIYKPIILSFDIECISPRENIMPCAQNPGDMITKISCVKYDTKTNMKDIRIFNLMPPGIVRDEEKHPTWYETSSERNLLISFKQYLEELSFEQLTGHNILGFDLPYINDRLILLGEQPLMATVPGFYSKPITIDTRKIKRKDVVKTTYFGHVTVVDYYHNYIMKYEANSMSGHKLEDCAIHFLSWEAEVKSNTITMPKNFYSRLLFETAKHIFCINTSEKIEVQVSDDKIILCDDMLDGKYQFSHCKTDVDFAGSFSAATYEEITEYCLHDAMLSICLYLNSMVHIKVTSYSAAMIIPQCQILLYENSRGLASILLQKATDQRIAYNSMEYEKKKYKAALVQEPTESDHPEPIIVLDINSMYPNIYKYLNLSHEMIVHMSSFPNKVDRAIDQAKIMKQYQYPEYCVIPSQLSDTCTMREYYLLVSKRTPEGFIASIMTDLLGKRDKAKKMMNMSNLMQELIDRKKMPNGKIILDGTVPDYTFTPTAWDEFNQDCQVVINILQQASPTAEQETILERLKIKWQSYEHHYNMVQLAYKLLSNAVYGLSGSSTFVFTCPPIAQACTAFGYRLDEYLIECANTCVVVEVDKSLSKLLDVSVEFFGDLSHPLTGKPISPFTKKNITPGKDSILIQLKTHCVYGDTDSIFVKCTQYEVLKNNTDRVLDLSGPCTKDMTMIAFLLGGKFEEIFNDVLLFNPIQLKFEKLLTCTHIAPKRYTYIIYNSLKAIVDDTRKLGFSGSTLKQRTSSDRHKKIILAMERLKRDVQQEGSPKEVVAEKLQQYIDGEIYKDWTAVMSKTVQLSSFMISKAFHMTSKVTEDHCVIKFNSSVAQGLRAEKNLTPINEGQRYFYVYIVPTTYPYTTSVVPVASTEYVITRDTKHLPDGYRLWIEHYIVALRNDIQRRFTNLVNIPEEGYSYMH